MDRVSIEAEYVCYTVRDLLDKLKAIESDPTLSAVLDSSLGSQADEFVGFKIIRRTLTDKSEVLDFVLIEGD